MPVVSRLSSFVAPPQPQRYPLPAGVHGVAVDHRGRVLFTDSYGPTRALYAVDRGQTLRLPLTGALPTGLLANATGIVICDAGASSVTHVDTSGRITAQWQVPQPWNVAYLTDGTLLAVSQDGTIYELADDGSVTPVIQGLRNPFGIAAAPDGSFWVSEQQPARVRRFELDGTVRQTLTARFTNPEGLLVDSRGALWVADTGGNHVHRFERGVETKRVAIDIPITMTELPSGDIAVVSSAPTAPGLVVLT